MDDMNAFERQIAGEIAVLMGPIRTVDDLAMFNHVTTTTKFPKWRFQTMFSAIKFVAAGVIVALFGGFLLAGVLTTPQGDEPAPAAITESASPEGTDPRSMSTGAVDFSGTLPYLGTKSLPEYATGSGGIVVTGDTYEGEFTDLDDPRLNGTVRFVINRIDHDGAGDVASYVARIDNDDGSWLGTGHGYLDTSNPAFDFAGGNLISGQLDTTVFRGIGAYEGLSAIMVSLPTDDETRVFGVVFPGEIPELPDMPEASE